jgi:proline iminopeptidase
MLCDGHKTIHKHGMKEKRNINMNEALHTPFKGHIAVDDTHKVYVEEFGKPGGLPIIFLHGGPGFGILDLEKQFFDPDKHHVIMFDQRGAGRSTPFCCLKDNDMDHLVQDIKFLLDHFGLKKAVLFGGSWGSTLAVAFAIKYPEYVRGMILRGLFLASDHECNRLNHGDINGAAASYFPEIWQQLLEAVPTEHHKNPIPFIADQLATLPHDSDEFKTLSHAFAHYELGMAKLDYDPVALNNLITELQPNITSLAVIESHYAKHNFFVGGPNGLLQHIDKIKHMPTIIVHGRYDILCEPIIAYKFAKKMDNAQLYFTKAGHASFEPETCEQLKTALATAAELW